MKILIAGGAGFIGSNLAGHFLHKKHEVLCVDNLLTGTLKNIDDLKNEPNFSFIKHDITKPLKIAEKIDAIFHLASPASPNHHSLLSYHALPMETMMANTQGTLELLKLAKAKSAKFLFASTSEVYGDPLTHPQKESYRGNVSTTGPRSVYDEAKRFGETITSYFERTGDVDTRIVRIFNTYGPKMAKADKRMIVAFINQALEGQPMTIYGDGRQTRSLCYVEDMVEGLDLAMFGKKTKGITINLGSDEEHTVGEFAKIIKNITHSKSKIVFSENLPADDPKKRRPDIALAKSLLNWRPVTSLESGLRKTINYFSNHNK